MSSGRCLFLLFFAALLSISMERPAVIEERQKIPKEKQEIESEGKEDSMVSKNRKMELNPSEEVDETNEPTETQYERNSIDFEDPNENLLRNNVITDEDLFDSLINDRINPKPIPEKLGKPYTCSKLIPSEIPKNYVCHMQFLVNDYSQYDVFIKHGMLPIIRKSLERKFDEYNPCYALWRNDNGKMRISCGCISKQSCDGLPKIAANIVRALRFRTSYQVKVKKTRGEKINQFLVEYQYLLSFGFIGLVLIIALSVIACIEWKGMKEIERKRNLRIKSLSERVEQSRKSLRSTCSEPSEEPEMQEESAFHRLMKKR